MKGGVWIAVAVVAIALLAVGGCLVGQYNRLVTADQKVKGGWAEVDNQLQRRSDLIGNLVETVKGVATQEQVVFGEIARARAALGGARTPEQAKSNAAAAHLPPIDTLHMAAVRDVYDEFIRKHVHHNW